MLEAPVEEHPVESSITPSTCELAFQELSKLKLKTIQVNQQKMTRDFDDELK